jgi:hypothetical protein
MATTGVSAVLIAFHRHDVYRPDFVACGRGTIARSLACVSAGFQVGVLAIPTGRCVVSRTLPGFPLMEEAALGILLGFVVHLFACLMARQYEPASKEPMLRNRNARNRQKRAMAKAHKANNKARAKTKEEQRQMKRGTRKNGKF